MTYQGLPDWLNRHKNEWLSAGEIAKLIILEGCGVTRASKNPATHTWVYANKDRIKNKSIGKAANGTGELRRYSVKSVWAVAKADGLSVTPTYAVSPIEQKLAALERANASLEYQVRSNVPDIRVIHAKREFTQSDLLMLRLLVVATDPRPRPGVYFLVSEAKGIVYVGQSKNVITRMAGHQEKQFDYARMIEIADDKQRLEIEMRLIKLLEPKDNLMGLAKAA